MVNNFFIGEVYHAKKRTKPAYREKTVLYSTDNITYIDLLNDMEYTTDNSDKNYVIEESIFPADINGYRTDYYYLLLRHNTLVKEKKVK